MTAPTHCKRVRHDHFIASSVVQGLKLRVRERFDEALAGSTHRTPVLMVHGATVSSLLWDHPLADWSWMNRFADDGFHVYALDIRGYGGSTRPAELGVTDPEAFAPYARAVDVQQDIEDAITFITQRHDVEHVDLLGGSWGSITCGLFASTERARMLRRLVLYAPIYDEGHTKTSWWHSAADPDNQNRVNPRLGAYRRVTREGLLRRWDEEIPLQDKTAWRSNEVFESLFRACLEEDAAAGGWEPDSFRAPNGTLVDLFGAYTGYPAFDAKKITVPTLLIRGDHDETSSRLGTMKLFDDLSAQQKVYVEVGNGAHFVILENQAPKVHQAVTSFLTERA